MKGGLTTEASAGAFGASGNSTDNSTDNDSEELYLGLTTGELEILGGGLFVGFLFGALVTVAAFKKEKTVSCVSTATPTSSLEKDRKIGCKVCRQPMLKKPDGEWYCARCGRDAGEQLFASLIRKEDRESVKSALVQSREAVEKLEESITLLEKKHSDLDHCLLKQKPRPEVEQAIQKYRQRLQQAKAIESMGTARTYAFMITKQKRKLDMMTRIQESVRRIKDKKTILIYLKTDLTETAYELPKEADLMGSMSIVSAAMGEVHNVDAIMNELTGIEDEIKGLAVETELASQESSVDIDSLPADVRAEIEREMEG